MIASRAGLAELNGILACFPDGATTMSPSRITYTSRAREAVRWRSAKVIQPNVLNW